MLPSESGQIEATLDIGARKGTQRKHITVPWRETVDGDGAEASPPQTTTVRLEGPKLRRLSFETSVIELYRRRERIRRVGGFEVARRRLDRLECGLNRRQVVGIVQLVCPVVRIIIIECQYAPSTDHGSLLLNQHRRAGARRHR